MSLLRRTPLGSPEIWLDSRLLSFRTAKAMALLVYLAVAGGAHARELLAVFLWPESDAAHGRQMLRTTLAHLRQTLETSPGEPIAHVSFERNVLSFNFSADFTLDLHEVDGVLRAQGAASEPGVLLP